MSNNIYENKSHSLRLICVRKHFLPYQISNCPEHFLEERTSVHTYFQYISTILDNLKYILQINALLNIIYLYIL